MGSINSRRKCVTICLFSFCTLVIWIYFLDEKGKSELQCLKNPCVTECKFKNNDNRCVYKAVSSMLTSECVGRLGNQMHSFATLFAMSHYHHRKAFMSPSGSDFISKYFKVTINTLNQSLYDEIEWSQKPVAGVLDNKYVQNLTEPYVKLIGVPQSWKYFHQIRPLILKQFQFHDYIVERSKLVLGSIREKFYPSKGQSVLIGVHVRRGDYIKKSAIVGFHIPGMKFYKGAMEYFQEMYRNRNLIFVVASDDKEWCIQKFSFWNDTFHIHVLDDIREDMPGLDMAILSLCDHLIYGLGTFGFWAGYLNQGQVIYCTDCITPTTKWLRSRRVYDGDYGNAVLPNWIGFSRRGVKTNRSVLARTNRLMWK